MLIPDEIEGMEDGMPAEECWDLLCEEADEQYGEDTYGECMAYSELFSEYEPCEWMKTYFGTTESDAYMFCSTVLA